MTKVEIKATLSQGHALTLRKLILTIIFVFY